MILLALALAGVGIWNLMVGASLIGWACSGMAILMAYVIIEKHAHGDR